MSAPGWSSDPRSRGWPGLAGPLPAGGEQQLDRWALSSSQLGRARGARSGWHAYRPSAAPALPPWAVEVTLTIERPVSTSPEPDQQGAAPKALLLLRSTGAVEALMLAVTGAMAEVEHVAGVHGREPGLRLVRSRPESGLEPLTPPIALCHLRQASHRGLAVRTRRRSSASPAASWEAGAGAVATCRGPAGLSAQAVVSLHGQGDPRSLRPPAGGAMVVRAWRLDRTGRGGRAGRAGRAGVVRRPGATWALASGVVLASSRTGGLGRAAGRLAASIRAEGWDATVLTGPAALGVARAGDPHQPAPRLAARRVTDDEVTAMLVTCLAAGMPM